MQVVDDLLGVLLFLRLVVCVRPRPEPDRLVGGFQQLGGCRGEAFLDLAAGGKRHCAGRGEVLGEDGQAHGGAEGGRPG
ncbi:hypothetical protein [Kitasatospora sp. NPDC088548]|uniref:hypothetical protein n=1 Tax=Kitasatospora sp. NPDC088548 TaxID=3364075 RepID=UPI00382B601B